MRAPSRIYFLLKPRERILPPTAALQWPCERSKSLIQRANCVLDDQNLFHVPVVEQQNITFRRSHDTSRPANRFHGKDVITRLFATTEQDKFGRISTAQPLCADRAASTR